jgi:hypothetical protein
MILAANLPQGIIYLQDSGKNNNRLLQSCRHLIGLVLSKTTTLPGLTLCEISYMRDDERAETEEKAGRIFGVVSR